MTAIAGQRIEVTRALVRPGGGACARDLSIATANGIITGCEPAPPGVREDELALPALVNAHDESVGLSDLALGFTDDMRDGNRGLTLDAYTSAAVAFGRQALAGIGTVVRLHRAAGDASLDRLRAVCRAANDVGIRLTVAFQSDDRESAALSIERGASFCRSAGVEFELVLPRSCPERFMRECAAMSAANGWRLRLLLPSTHADLRQLETSGLLSERLDIVGGASLGDDDIRAIAAAGASVVIDTMERAHPRSGPATIEKLLQAGVPLAFGLSSRSLDDDGDALRDLRVAYLLNAHHMTSRHLDAANLFSAVFRNGFAIATGTPDYGEIAPGRPADLAMLRMDSLAPDRIEGTISEEALFLTRASAAQLSRLYVRGRQIVGDGRLLTVDLPALKRRLVRQARKAAMVPHAVDERDG